MAGWLLGSGGGEYGALLDVAVVHGGKDAVDVGQRVRLDERLERNLAVEHEVERRRVVFRWTTPVADGACIEGHQVGQADLDLVHRETHHAERGAVYQQAEGAGLARSGARALEDLPLCVAQAVGLGEGGDGGLQCLRVVRARVERQVGAMRGDRGQLVVVDVDRDHAGTEGARDLHAITADAADADHHRQAARRHAGAAHRLVRCGQRVGDDRYLGQAEPGGRQPLLVDRAQTATRHHDVRGEAALDVVARHLLGAADRGQAAPAQVTFAARQHGRHDHRLAEPALGTGAGGDHMAADLVPQRQRQRRIGAHAVVVVAQVGVTDAAAGDPDHDFSGRRLRFEAGLHQRRVGRGHQPAVGVDAHGGISCSTAAGRASGLAAAGLTGRSEGPIVV